MGQGDLILPGNIEFHYMIRLDLTAEFAGREDLMQFYATICKPGKYLKYLVSLGYGNLRQFQQSLSGDVLEVVEE